MLTDTQLAVLATAARNGALLMDDKQPGWAQEVNPATLAIHSITRCVIGQSMTPRLVGGAYTRKVARLGIALEETPLYGFALTAEQARNYETWGALTDAWRVEIASRTAVTTPSPADAQEELVLAA